MNDQVSQLCKDITNLNSNQNEANILDYECWEHLNFII